MNKFYFKSAGIFILIAFLSLNKGFAQQQKTAYEKKIEKITEKYLSISLYGYNKPLTMSEKAEIKMYGKDGRDFILNIALLNYIMSHTEAEAKNFIKNYERDLKAAEKLKTSVDFKREKERKALQAQKEFEETDKGKIKKNIKEKFQLWCEKGEFEKQADYEIRLKDNSKNKFNDICVEQIKSQINNVYYYIKKDLLPYDADNEFFTVLFKLNKKEWKSKIHIPIDKAVNFKNIWNTLKLQKNYYDWCFVDNSLFPTIITLREEKGYNEYGNTKYTLNLTLKNENEITYSFDNLEINNKYLKGYVFKYSSAKELARQRFLRDSLSYNSLFAKYNEMLLKNPYNVNKRFLDIQPLKKSDNLDDEIVSLKQNYEELNNEIESTLKRNQPKEYCKIYYSINPDKKVEADKKYINCKCNLTREKYDIKFIDNELSSDYCNCREKEYRKHGNLFNDKNEFDKYFEKGDSIYTNEIEKRTFIAYINKNIEIIKSLDLKKNKKESFGVSLLKEFADMPHSNYESENQIRENIINIILNSQNKSYYPLIIDKLIETNHILNKEWSKNGKYFSDKVDFFDTYMLIDYKKKLKERKKANG